MWSRIMRTVTGLCLAGLCGACAGARREAPARDDAGSRIVAASWRDDRAWRRVLLAQGADVNARGPQGQTALEGAAWNGDAEGVEALVRAGAHVATPPDRALHFAAVRGHAPVVQQLLAAGADPDLRDGSGRSPLSLAALAGSLAVVQTLLDAGAEPELRSDTGMTALMNAAQQGHSEIAALLVRHGAKVAARRDDGRTAWTMAVERNDRRMMEILHAGLPPRGTGVGERAYPVRHGAGSGALGRAVERATRVTR